MFSQYPPPLAVSKKKKPQETNKALGIGRENSETGLLNEAKERKSGCVSLNVLDFEDA